MDIRSKLLSCSVPLKRQFLLDFYALFVHCADVQERVLKKILLLLAVLPKVKTNKFLVSLVFMDFLEIRHRLASFFQNSPLFGSRSPLPFSVMCVVSGQSCPCEHGGVFLPALCTTLHAGLCVPASLPAQRSCALCSCDPHWSSASPAASVSSLPRLWFPVLCPHHHCCTQMAPSGTTGDLFHDRLPACLSSRHGCGNSFPQNRGLPTTALRLTLALPLFLSIVLWEHDPAHLPT